VAVWSQWSAEGKMSRAGHRAVWGFAAMVAVLAGALAIFWAKVPADPLTRARRAYDRGDWDQAVRALRGEVRTRSGRTSDPEVLRTYARALARLERDSAAGAIYEKGLASAELEPEDAFLKGLVFARNGRPETALDLWAGVVNKGVEHPEMLDHYSRLSARFQHMDQALEAARRLARQRGWEARGLFLVGQIDELIDDPPGVVESLEEALRRDPEGRGAVLDVSHYRKLLARNLLRLGRAADAERRLMAIPSPELAGSSREGADPEVQWLLSRAYLEQGRMTEASQALGRSGSYAADHRLTAEPGLYVGSSVCAPCHREQSRAYDSTRHARTFFHAAGLLDLPRPDRPVADPDDPKVMHAIERKGDRIEASSRIDGRVSRMVVEYAFGTPEHYVTMIARDEAKTYRSLRVSYYRTAKESGWGATSGDVGHSDSVEDRLGQRIAVRDGVVRCLHCHVTRSRNFRDPPPSGGPGPESADRAIGCERCHGPGGNHVRAVARDFRDPQGSADYAIVNVAGTPGATANGQCVECHTVGLPSQIERDPENPGYARSPGVTFALSRCFTESAGAMSCMTCHDPHREADHSASFYEAKCLTCHSATPAAAKAPAAAPAGRRKACPVNPTNDCLTCHMPKVPMPTLHKSLTDHYIRIRREDKPPAKPRHSYH
jgi:tetratricopeptide (TPR) repeat protein